MSALRGFSRLIAAGFCGPPPPPIAARAGLSRLFVAAAFPRRLLSTPPSPPPADASDEALFASVQFLAGEPCPRPQQRSLRHISLWEVVRLLKLEEEMRGVAGYPQLRVPCLLAHARSLLEALHWGAEGRAPQAPRPRATPRDYAALHALCVFLADRRDAPLPLPQLEPQQTAAADLPVSSTRAFCVAHLAPCIASAVDARAWPATAVVDIAATMCPHQLLSLDAIGAILSYAEAIGPAALSLGDTVDLFLAVSGCAQLRAASLGDAAPGSVSLDAVATMQQSVNELLLASAHRLSVRLLHALKVPAAQQHRQPTLPLPQLVALAEQCEARFDGRGEKLIAEPPFSHPLLQLGCSIAISAVPAVRAAAAASSAAALPVPAAAPAPAPGAPPPAPSAEEAASLASAALALRLCKCLAAMGLWVDPLLEALGEAWDRHWGARLFPHLPPAVASDALFLASLSAAARRARPHAPQGWAFPRPPPAAFPPLPRRLSAALSRDGCALVLQQSAYESAAQGGRPPQLRVALLRDGSGSSAAEEAVRARFPACWRAMQSEVAAALAAAGEDGRSGGSEGAAPRLAALHAAAALLAEPARAAQGARGRLPFVTAEGVLLHAAVPSARLGLRLVSAADVRPSLDGLSAALLAELSVAESAGWVVELVLEGALGEGGGSEAVVRRAAEALLAAELARRGHGDGAWGQLVSGEPWRLPQQLQAAVQNNVCA